MTEADWPEGVSVYAIVEADGHVVQRATLTAESPSVIFSNLPAESGSDEIEYTVREELSEDVLCSQEAINIGNSEQMDNWLLRNTLPAPIPLPLTGSPGFAILIVLAFGLITMGNLLYLRNRRIGSIKRGLL